MSGFIVFAVLGNISYILDKDIRELAVQGPELVFVAYPQAFIQMFPSQMWSLLFFLTLFILGIDSVFSSIEVVNTSINDFFKEKGYKCKWPLLQAVLIVF